MDNKKLFYSLAMLLILTIACSSFSINFSIDPTPKDAPPSDSPVTTSPSESKDKEEEPEATEPTEEEVIPKGGGQFSNADEVIENPPDTNVFTSPTGQLYVEVRIKSGPDIKTFTQDTQDGCFEILGFGTPTIVVNRVGSGPNCKEFGGIGLYYGD